MSSRNGTALEAPPKAATLGSDAPVTYRGPLQGLADLAELLGGESADSKRFLRGLALGALVGAAIAGSTLWQRRRKGRS
jgi:hypothetical protein